MSTCPGPWARFVPAVVTATGVDRQGTPLEPTTRFRANEPVVVVCTVAEVGREQAHRLSVRWLLEGALAQVAGSHTSTIVTSNGPIAFSLAFPAPGAGLAKLYWDEPVGDNNDAADERFLAHTVAFAVV